jgi:hypothetical protein
MTRGFPSYRARANMVVDETPGKTYLFGGYVVRAGSSSQTYSSHVMQGTYTQIVLRSSSYYSCSRSTQMQPSYVILPHPPVCAIKDHHQVPSDKYVFTRTFNDVWQFLLDTPGGHFDDTDLRTDTDAPRMGPWKRCFA